MLQAGAIAIMVAVVAVSAGYFLNTLVFGQDRPAPGAIITTDCIKCGAINTQRIVDITKSKCNKCSGALGYAMKCNACKKPFALTENSIDNLKDKATIIAKLQEIRKCPECGSHNITLAPHTAQNASGNKVR